MATPNNSHQLSQSHPLVHHTSTIDHLQLSLVQPPFGYILQLTPQTAFLIIKNNNYDSNIMYGVYRPCIGMPGNYHCFGYSQVTNFEQEQMGRDVMQIINLELQQVGRDVMQVMILKLRPMERDGSEIVDMTNADFEAMGDLMMLSNEIHNPEVGNASPGISTPVRPFLDLNMPPPVEPLDLNMPPPVQPLDLNMPPPVQPLDLNLPPMEEGDEQHTDQMTMHGLEINHPSLVPHPEEEVARTGITLDSVLNILTSHYDRTYEENLELEEQMGRVDSGLSEETIMQHLQITNYTATTRSPSEEPDICVICQGEFENDESIGGLQCAHEYHVQCIKTWLQRINKCPICKSPAVS